MRIYPSNSRPAKILTDAGAGFAKGLGSPSGPGSLASELIAAELATKMGLKVPPFAVIYSSQIDIPMVGIAEPMNDPLFFSQEIGGAYPGDGTGFFLRKLASPGDIAKLVVLDTWLRNHDRYSDAFGVGPVSNRDNLLFRPREDGRFDVHPIDHANCFVTGELEVAALSDPVALRDKQIYGLFPEFRAYLTPDGVADAIASMEAISEPDMLEVVNSVPASWGMSPGIRAALVSFSAQRCQFVAATISPKLVDQPKLVLNGRAD